MDILLRDEEVIMAEELYKAAMSDNNNFIDNFMNNDEYLLKKTLVSNNIMHVAIRHNSIHFVHKAVLKFPHLMWEKNLDGNTPLHVAAEMVGNEEFVRQVCDELPNHMSMNLRMQNSMGNTPLHVAIIHNNFDVAKILVNKDPSLSTVVNASMEAPLHLAIQYYPDGDDPVDEASKLRRVIEQKKTDWDIGDYAPPHQQKMVIMIALLLEKARNVAGWRDASGLTPLHKSASLNTRYNLQIVNLIICECQLSVEVSDNFGKTILHHLVNKIVYYHEGMEFLSKPHTQGLRNCQDHDGNTALHLVVINKDLVMLQILENLNVNRFIKNKEGLSAATLIQQTNILKMTKTGIMMREETGDRAECGDVFTLREHLEELGRHFLQSHDFEGRNLVHKLFNMKWGRVIVPRDFLEFMEYLLDFSPQYLSETDRNGDTAIHILAQLNPDSIMIHMATTLRDNPTYTDNLYPGPKPQDPRCFYTSFQEWNYVWESLGRTPFLTNLLHLCLKYFDRGWLTPNVKGNTALHEAILAKNYQVFIKLAELHKEATTMVNKHNETILHLLATLNPTPLIADDVMVDIIQTNTRDERYLIDQDGLSPVMRAIRAGNIHYAEKLCFVSSKLAELRDPNGQTFWHMIVNMPLIDSFNFANSSFTNEVVLSMLDKKDKDENTALHLAIEFLKFDVAQLFLDLRGTTTSNRIHNFNTRLLGIPNKVGITPGDMIGSLPYLPPEFEKFIWKDSTMIGTRSMWGIPTTQMKDYVNTMGVIAALLTTITFTAAFTVPGGLNQEQDDRMKGTPLLIQDPAFQIFIISDVLAMCLSMIVLFCLLWIMATGDKSKSVVLLDFSIILLLASFYTTLLTFMTGLYATMHIVKPWIAIVSLVMCSMLLLLMHKYLVIKLMIPSGKNILIFADKGYNCARKTFRYANNVRKRGMSLIKKCCSPCSLPPPRATVAHVI